MRCEQSHDTAGAHLLVVDDHPDIRQSLTLYLQRQGWRVPAAADAREADALLARERIDLVVLDVMMPGESGFDLTTWIRSQAALSKTPVLLLTAQSTLAQRVQGLNGGADDYLTKPFELDELDARLRALLRRSHGQTAQTQRLGQLERDSEGYFLLNHKPLSLTPRESSVLSTLMQRPGRPVSRQHLYEQTFTLADDASPESIELYVHRVRKKLSGSDVAIVTLRGLGYSLEQQPCG